MAAALRSLLSIIQDSVQRIEDGFEQRGVAFPSLDVPVTPADASVQVLQDPQVQEASLLLTAAASQLIAAVQPPQATAFNAGTSYYLSASLRTAIELNVVEILREAGPQGLHVRDIAAKANVDSTKLSRILCYLATHHIFKEVKPDVYANNRISSIWDTGKTNSDIRSQPLEKYDGTNGIAALIAHCADEDYKGAGYIVEHLTDPDTAFEDSMERSPMMLAFKSDEGVWSWLEQPWNVMRLKRFGVAMDGVSKMQPPDSILKGFDWASLAEGSVVVDVGGGIGVSSITLVQAHPHLQCIVQDRPLVVEQGRIHCAQTLPGALESGKITYEEHDFFTAQPSDRSVSVFLLKQIMHDWSNRYALRILSRLREAASPETQLVIIDSIIPHTCPADEISIPGAKFTTPPAPLLANMGAANTAPYFTDLSMYVHFNGMERKLEQSVELLKKAGWEVVQVHASDGSGRYLSQIVAVPIAAR
ncbi:S-adenosyl-L-methionine-dependent methyltransferase [Dentipellis sp. KUC8613]|nr:S-adenosyl-L-methionine-dependent methyltransferase [Dentipellis sp. KUC8613]